MTRESVRAGDHALLVELGDVAAVALHAGAAAVRNVSGVIACIAGQRSLLVVFRDRPDPLAIELALNAPPAVAMAVAHHAIRVNFDARHALDLEQLLTRTGLTRSAFLSQLESLSMTARYLGFRAGFAYLEGWPELWSLPRRPTSRNLVPRGSFAIAGSMAGFYPVDSPGGWNVLGRTGETLWDERRDPPNLIAPGDHLRIVPADNDVIPSAPPAEARSETETAGAMVEVISPGQLTLIVGTRDWSRAQYGIPPGGPFDGDAMARANQAAGNASSAATLECVLVGPRLRFTQSRAIGWCSGAGEVEHRRVEAGEEYDVGRIRGGLRGYLAIEGGFHDPRVRFAETPVRIRAGDGLRSAEEHLAAPATSAPVVGSVMDSGMDSVLSRQDRLAIRIVPGPHDAPPLPNAWEVSAQMNRIGIRLTPLVRVLLTLPTDLPSCGMQFGTLQWHPDGSLMAMGPDHPVTGGYLQPATVLTEDLWKLGQLAPGDRVRLLTV